MATPVLGLTFVSQGQAQKEVTLNSDLTILDALAQISVLSRAVTSPPGSPAEGDRYIIPTGASGAWTGLTNKVAAYQNGTWNYYTPGVGWIAYVQDERALATYADSVWQTRLAGTSHGGAVNIVATEEEITLSGASTAATGAGIIQNGDILLAVASRTTQAITGATSYSVGVSGNTGQFGSGLGVALGSTNRGIIGPTGFYSNTPVLITSAGGSFTGGKVRVIRYAMTFAVPTS
jgi:hypothetical protein